MARSEIWFVDDDTPTAKDILRYWESVGGAALEFRHFPTAREAWNALQGGDGFPSAIVINGHLDADEGELADRAGFVRRVRSLHGPSQPVLLAFSGDDYALGEMERAGAEAGFYKGNVRGVVEYLAASSKIGREA